MSKQQVWRSGKEHKLDKDTRVVWAGCNCVRTIRTLLRLNHDIVGVEVWVELTPMNNGLTKHTIYHRVK